MRNPAPRETPNFAVRVKRVRLHSLELRNRDRLSDYQIGLQSAALIPYAEYVIQLSNLRKIMFVKPFWLAYSVGQWVYKN